MNRIRENGIGWALLKYVAKTAVDRGYQRMEWGVLDWNKRAIAFYENVDATAMNRWTKYRLSEEALGGLVP